MPEVEEDGEHVPVTALGPTTFRLVGQPAVRPVDGETVGVRVTVPVKPPIGVIVTVELPAAPLLKSAGEVTVIEKSPLKVKIAIVEWEAVPGVPVPLMVTIKAPAAGAVQDREEVPVEFAVSGTGVVVNGWHVKPVGTVSVRATEPTKF